jgi:DNA repair exonuclease SbcCD ATPase subunit
MRLIRLDLENWCSHEHLKVDLSEGLQIEGRNGTGKSSILKAIRLIFKETARGYSGRIRNGSRSALVRLRFEFDQIEYDVEKIIYVDKPSSAKMMANGVQIADNPSSVHQRLHAILPEEMFENLLYISQGGLTKILDRLSGKEGKLELDRLFGLDRLEQIWERVGLEKQELECKLGFLNEEKMRYPENSKEALKIAIDESDMVSVDLRVKISTSSAELQNVKVLMNSIQEQLRRLQESKRMLDKFTEEYNRLLVEDAQASKELDSIRQRLAETSERQKELNELYESMRNLEKYKRIRGALGDLRSTEEGLARLSGLKVKKTRLIDLSKRLKDKVIVEKEFLDLQESSRKAEGNYAAASFDLNSVREYLNQLSSLEGQAKCPRCGQRLNAFELEKERRESSIRLQSSERMKVELSFEVEALRMSLKSKESDLSRLRISEVEFNHLDNELREKEMEYAKLAKSKETISLGLIELGYKDEDFSFVEAKYGELIRIEGRIQSLQREVEGVSKLKGRDNEVEIRMTQIKRMISEIETKRGEFSYSESENSRLILERDRLYESRYRLEGDIKTYEADHIRNLKVKSDAESKLKEYSDLVVRLDKTKKRVELLITARDVFHRDKGIVRFLREGYIKKLNSLLTSHFKAYNQNPKYIDVTFDKDYGIIVRTTQGDLEIGQLSGGELVQLALALRITLIDLMSPIRLLILDEPFGGLDEEHRELLGESLNRIATQGQLILVTHVHVESLRLANSLNLGGY